MVNVILTPDADAADGNWKTQTGGTSLFEVIDEPSPNDSDYIISGSDPTADIVKIRLSNPTGLVNQPMTVSVRSRKAGWSAVNLTTRLVEGTTTRASWVDALTPTWTTYSHELTEAELATITDFNDLYVEMEANLSPEICLAARYLNCLRAGYTPWAEHQGGVPVGTNNNLHWNDFKSEPDPVRPADFASQWYEELYGETNTPVLTYPGATIDPSLVTALDGTETACKIVESFDDVPPAIPAGGVKPSAINLATSRPTAWDGDFWDYAVAVIPAWEGTGNPAYYGAGGALLGTCVPYNSPAWGTITGHGASLSLGPNDGLVTPDWRIPAVAGEDIVPTDAVTMLLVTKNKSSTGRHFIGLPTIGVPDWEHTFEAYFPSGQSNRSTEQIFGNSNAGNCFDYAPSDTLKFWAFTAGPGGWTCYEHQPATYVAGDNLYNQARTGAAYLSHNNGTYTRSKTALDFRLNMGQDTAREANSPGADILFFALLNTEWNAEQVRVWMLDPYAPVREGNTRPTYPDIKTYHYVTAGATVGVSNVGSYPFRFTAFAKAGERKRLTLMVGEAVYNNQTNGLRCTFDLENGTIAVDPWLVESIRAYETTTWTSIDVTMVPFGGGWYKVSFDYLPPYKPNAISDFANTTHKFRLMIDAGTGDDAENILYAGDGTSGLYVWKTNVLPLPAFEQITTEAFFDDFDDPDTVDINDTRGGGYNWYVSQITPIFDAAAGDPPPPERLSIANSVLEQTTLQPYAVPGVTIANPDLYTQNQGLMSWCYKGGATGHGTGLLPENYVGRAFKYYPAVVQCRMATDLLYPLDPTEPESHGIPGTFTLSNTSGLGAASHGNYYLHRPGIWSVPMEAYLSPCPNAEGMPEAFPGMVGTNIPYIEYDLLEWPGGGSLLQTWTPVDGACTAYARDAWDLNGSAFGHYPISWSATAITPEEGSPASLQEPPELDLSGMHTYSWLFLKETATTPPMVFSFFDGLITGSAFIPAGYEISNEHHHVLHFGGYHSKWDFVRVLNDGAADAVWESNGE